MRMRDALPGKYLTADDLDGEVVVTIDRVVLEPFRDPRTRVETHKPVMYFQRAKRGLIVNRTNWRAVADLYGDESDNWTGKRIALVSVMVDAYGRQTKGVRVRPARAAPAAARNGRPEPKAQDPALTFPRQGSSVAHESAATPAS